MKSPRYIIILILLLLIPVVFLSKDNLINTAFRKIYSKRIIKSTNKLPEMSFLILDKKENEEKVTKFSTKDMIGRKYILHFFASWCGYCIAEHSNFFILKNRDIPVYGIAWRDSPENIRNLIEKIGDPYEKILLDPFGFESSGINIVGIPMTIIINSKGEVVFGKAGEANIDILIKEFNSAD